MTAHIHDGFLRATALTYGNGAVTTYAYDTAGALASLSQNFSGSSSDVTFAYARDKTGMVVTKDISNSAYAWSVPANDTITYFTNVASLRGMLQ